MKYHVYLFGRFQHILFSNYDKVASIINENFKTLRKIRITVSFPIREIPIGGFQHSADECFENEAYISFLQNHIRFDSSG